MFGGAGFRHTIDYAPFVASLDVWEIDPDREPALRRNLPGARILITDSIEEIRQTPNRYGIVVVDNATPFGGRLVEHFDLFPDLFRIATDPCVLILNACPSPAGGSRRDPALASRRAAFYRTDTPLDVPMERMVETYVRLMAERGLRLDWNFHLKRAYRTGIHYLVMQMSSSPAVFQKGGRV